jgi:uncharacterized protein YbjT (DUF2867 family)
MIAVMGASGNVGGVVVDLLLERSEGIRVLQHHRSLDGLRARRAEVVEGDARSAHDLARLFAGADAALVLLPDVVADARFTASRSRMSRAITDALAQAAVGHVVALSAVGADRPDAVGPPAGLHELEERLSALQDANVLLLRSAFYMENLLAALPLIRSQGVNGSAIRGDLPFPMIATEDVAREAADRLQLRDFTGHGDRLLLGPEDVSMLEATRTIGARLGVPDLPYAEFPPGGVRAALESAGMSAEAAAAIVDMQLALNEGRPFGGVRRTAASSTPTRLEAFLDAALAG